MSESVAQDQIKAFVERIELLEEERKAIARDIAEVYAEAKGNGFDRKALKQVVRIRAMDHHERMELEALVDLYLNALGTACYLDDDEPSHVHVHVREDYQFPADGVTVSNTSSTAARKDVQQPTAGYELGVGSASGNPRYAREGLGQDIPVADTQAPPVETYSVPAALTPETAEPGDRGSAPSLAASSVVAFRTHNPETHFLSKDGLPRLHGCSKPDACAGSHRKLCFGCSVVHDGPSPSGEVA